MPSLKDYSRLFYLAKETAAIDDQIQRIRDALTAIPGMRWDRDGSRAGGTPESRVERLTLELIDLETLAGLKRQEARIERERLVRVIDEADTDETTKELMRQRFVELKAWNEMGGETARKKVYRSMRKYEEA